MPRWVRVLAFLGSLPLVAVCSMVPVLVGAPAWVVVLGLGVWCLLLVLVIRRRRRPVAGAVDRSVSVRGGGYL